MTITITRTDHSFVVASEIGLLGWYESLDDAVYAANEAFGSSLAAWQATDEPVWTLINPTPAVKIARDAYLSSDIDELTFSIDEAAADAATLRVASEWIALGSEYDGDEFMGYSWSHWSDETDQYGDVWSEITSQDGGDEHAARQAVAEWLARFAS